MGILTGGSIALRARTVDYVSLNTCVYPKKVFIFNLLVHKRFRIQACVSTSCLADLEHGKILPPLDFVIRSGVGLGSHLFCLLSP